MTTENQGTALTQLSEALAGAVERAGGYTVAVNARRRMPASGIAWAEGLIITANHVIEREENITVTLPDGRDVPATLAGRDPGSDLALLRAAHGLAPAPRAGAARPGHIALAVGRPGKDGLTAAMGAVSAVGGAWRAGRGGAVDGYIRADVTMYPGCSGGPLVDAVGALIGVNTSAFGGSLTIPAEAVEKVAAQLGQHGRLKRGYLGLTSQQVKLPAQLAQAAGQESGLLIARVEPGSPADQGGLLLGDILIGLAGQQVADADALQTLLGPDRVNQPTPVRIVRGGELREITVTVGERQAA